MFVTTSGHVIVRLFELENEPYFTQATFRQDTLRNIDR